MAGEREREPKTFPNPISSLLTALRDLDVRVMDMAGRGELAPHYDLVRNPNGSIKGVHVKFYVASDQLF